MLKFAILTESARRAVDWIKEAYPANTTLIRHTSLTGTIRLHNVDREFVIVTTEERLRGLQLMGYEVVGNVSTGLILTASMQVRQ